MFLRISTKMKKFSSKKNAWHPQSITSENVAEVQKLFQKDMQIREKSRIVLNGRVPSGDLSEADDCSEALEYEFLYSVSDDENGDVYSYEFGTYPVSHNSSKDETVERSHEINENVYGTKEKRVASAPILRSDAKLFTEQKAEQVLDTERERKTSTVLFRTESNSEGSAEKIKDRKISTVSKASSSHTDRSVYSQQKIDHQKRKSVTYDPALEKASVFIHGGSKNFSRANTSLSPLKHGMRHLQMNYTETNLETNQSLIFLDLLKTSHQQSQLRRQQIRNTERRLEIRRNNPLYSTSYYEHKHLEDPFHRNVKKTARSAAQKKLERKKKIKQMTDEIQTGYVPTQMTMKIADQKEVEDIGRKCRYLRCTAPPNEARIV